MIRSRTPRSSVALSLAAILASCSPGSGASVPGDGGEAPAARPGAPPSASSTVTGGGGVVDAAASDAPHPPGEGCPCAAGQYCDLATNTCRQGCTADEQCGARELCNLDTRTCGRGCLKDDACDLGQLCDVTKKTCLPGCLSDAACSKGQWCDVSKKACAAGCRGDGDCSAIEQCVTHACVNHCTSNCDDTNDCTADTCEKSACQHRPANEWATCPDFSMTGREALCLAGICSMPAHDCICSGVRCDDNQQGLLVQEGRSCGCTSATSYTFTNFGAQVFTARCNGGCTQRGTETICVDH